MITHERAISASSAWVARASRAAIAVCVAKLAQQQRAKQPPGNLLGQANADQSLRPGPGAATARALKSVRWLERHMLRPQQVRQTARLHAASRAASACCVSAAGAWLAVRRSSCAYSPRPARRTRAVRAARRSPQCCARAARGTRRRGPSRRAGPLGGAKRRVKRCIAHLDRHEYQQHSAVASARRTWAMARRTVHHRPSRQPRGQYGGIGVGGGACVVVLDDRLERANLAQRSRTRAATLALTNRPGGALTERKSPCAPVATRSLSRET